MIRAGLLAALALALAAPALNAARFPSDPNVLFQTSGCRRAASIGDWYTSQDSASSARYGEFFLEVTPAMAPATIVILDADSNGALDEVSNANDPTRFELRSGDGATLLDSRDVTGAVDGTDVSFASLGEGLYRLRSYVGGDQIAAAGAYCDEPAGENDDDNGFAIQVNGNAAVDGLLGFLQTTYQQSSGASANYQMYFMVGPALADSTLQFRNFDLDGGAAAAVYNRPPDAAGVAVVGTVSGNGSWNGPGGSLNAGEDAVTADNDLASGALEAGVWGYRIEGWTDSNQTIFEANESGWRLALTDRLPTRAGFFAISADGTRATVAGTPVDHPFIVTNQFFASDLVNFSLAGTGAGYTTELRSDPDCDGAGDDGVPLTDTDADGAVDSGLLTIAGSAGASRCFVLRVTPDAGAAGPDTTTISAVSFMDARVGAANTTRSIARTTTLTPTHLTLAKSVTVVSDPLNGTTAPRRIPGAVLEYTLVVTNPGVGADALVVTDELPAPTRYVPASLVVDGTPEDDDASGPDEADTAGGDFGVTTPGAVTARLPTLAAGASATISFRVVLD